MECGALAIIIGSWWFCITVFLENLSVAIPWFGIGYATSCFIYGQEFFLKTKGSRTGDVPKAGCARSC
jgi:hypothetical protein